MIEFSEAFKSGWDDYYNGDHQNRYYFDDDVHAFRAWIKGYNAAKEWDGLMEDVDD